MSRNKLKTPQSYRRLFIVLLCGVTCFGQSGQSVQQREAIKARLARHIKDFDHLDYGPPVDKKKLNAFGEIDLSAGMLVDYPYGGGDSTNLKELLADIARRSKLIVVGSARSFQSAFTQKRSFLVSVWDFSVDEVLKNLSPERVSPGSQIEILRSGGQTTWGNTVVIAHDFAFPDFVVGDKLVLFLIEVPGEPGTYRATDWGSFRIQNGRVKRIIDPNNRSSQLTEAVGALSADEFINQVRRIQ
jgi:hypothetical protein